MTALTKKEIEDVTVVNLDAKLAEANVVAYWLLLLLKIHMA